MIGGWGGLEEEESGTTKTVLRAELIGDAPTKTQGRIFLISEPWVGSRLTHHTPPLWSLVDAIAHRHIPVSHVSI